MTNNKKNSLMKIRSLFVLFSVLLFACHPENKETQLSEDELNMEAALVEKTAQELDGDHSFYILPSPLQIASIFKKSGLAYLPGLINPSSNSKKYTVSFSKSIGIGLYSADVAYCVINNQTQESMNSMKALKQLADEMGISSVFESDALMTRFERNIAKEDSLVEILSDIQMELDVFLEENEQKHIAITIFSGAWIESMYLASKTVQSKKNGVLSKRLGEQYIILSNIVKALKKHKEEIAGFPALLKDLESIKQIFDQFSFITNKGADEEMSENTGVSDEEIKTLTTKLEEIRTKLINGTI